MEEETDSFPRAWPIVLAVQILLCKLLKKFCFLNLTVVECSNLIVNSGIELEGDGIEGHIDFEVLIAYSYGSSAQGTLLRVLNQEFQDTELTEAMTTLKGDGLDKLA